MSANNRLPWNWGDIFQSPARLVTHYATEQAVAKAELIYTFHVGNWFDVQWVKQEALVVPTRAVAEADLPPGVAAYFVQLTDEEGCSVSSPVVRTDRDG